MDAPGGAIFARVSFYSTPELLGAIARISVAKVPGQHNLRSL